MKESKVEEFLRKVDRPWGMSMTELEQFQSEVKQLKAEQNKVAVEKLEELLDWVDAHKQPIGYALRCEINSKIQELKGIKYQ